MFGIRSVAFAVIASAVLVTPASALTLDFDSGTYDWDKGFLIGYSQSGLDFDISHSGANSDGATLFNAVCPGGVNPNNQASECGSAGDDQDLVPIAGDEDGIVENILIRQERGRTNADDARGQGDITFTLVSGQAFRVLGFSAIDNEDFAILVGGVEQGKIQHDAEKQTTALTFLNPSPVTTSFTVRYFGSGGVDSIVLAPVPVPAAGFLLLGGLGALALLRRRRPA